MHTIALVLSQNVVDSQVLVDGHDITSACTGVEVRAMIGDVLRVTLHLTGRVEVLADVDRIEFRHPPEVPRADA